MCWVWQTWTSLSLYLSSYFPLREFCHVLLRSSGRHDILKGFCLLSHSGMTLYISFQVFRTSVCNSHAKITETVKLFNFTQLEPIILSHFFNHIWYMYVYYVMYSALTVGMLFLFLLATSHKVTPTCLEDLQVKIQSGNEKSLSISKSVITLMWGFFVEVFQCCEPSCFFNT